MSTNEASVLLHEGISAARSGDRTRACILLRQVAEIDPLNEIAWLWRASSAESPLESLDCLRKVLELNPNSEHARKSLPDILVRAAAACAGNRVKAKAFLIEATSLVPRHEMAWLWRAGLSDTPDEAMEHLRTVLSINPNNQKAQAGLAKYELEAMPQWHCPICMAGSTTNNNICPKCGCVLSIEDPVSFDNLRTVNRSIVEPAAKTLYATVRDEATSANAYILGLVYLNLGYRDEGIRTIQAAIRMKGALPAWAGQLALFGKHNTAKNGRTADEPQKQIVKPMVMVVDDSPTIRKLVSVTLSGAGYRVIEADGGHAAANLIREHGKPGVLVLDVNMPGMDGFTFCKTLRSNPETAKTPVVFLTGKDGLFNKLRGQWAGASEYLTKPFDPQKLLATIRKLLPIATAN